MNANVKERAESLFYEAIERSAEDRELFLKEACGSDENLRAEVDELLRADAEAGVFLREDATLLRDNAARASSFEAEFAPLKPEEAGDRIGNYKLLQQIGEGGFGVVWMAEQERPVRRRVALKIIKLGMDTKEVIARFEQERQALAMMDHPNIAKVLDAGATPVGRPYFVMELVRGVKITEFCDEAKLSTAERLGLFIQVCHAVQHAHQKGIIHRDLKPNNILVSLHDTVAVPKVIDFGIAKATQAQRLTDLTLFTQFEQMVGTPLYMSPEQAQLSGLDIDTRSDIYSLGVLLYELLTGRTPFDPEELMSQGLDEIRRVIREQEPQKPSTFVSTMAAAARTNLAQHRQIDGAKLTGQIRGDLDWIVMKALEKDRSRRYESVSGFAADIERHLSSEPVQARPPTRLYRFRRFARRNKGAFAAGSAVLAALLIGLAVSLWMFFQEKLARKEAEAAKNESRQVAQFLTEMLSGVAPSVALGRDTALLREILDKTVERVGKDLKGQPAVQSQLLFLIAMVYTELGDLEKAGRMHEDVLAIRRTIFGEEHEEVAKSLATLAEVLRQQASYADAEPLARQSVGIFRKLLGNEALPVGHALNFLGAILASQGKRAEAEAIYRQSLAILRKHEGNESIGVADALHSLAAILQGESKLDEAEKLFRESLDIKRKHAPKAPNTAGTLDNLAQVLQAQGKLLDAEEMYREAFAMRIQLFGDEHTAVACSLNNIGNLLQEQGKLPEAESMLREGEAMYRKLMGNDHPDLAALLNNLGNVLRDRGKFAESETVHREALRIRRKMPGIEQSDLLSTLHALGESLSRQNKLAESEAVYREGLSTVTALFGEQDRKFAAWATRLAEVLERRGKVGEAESLRRQAVPIRRKVFGDEHWRVGTGLRNLAILLEKQNKLAEAERTYRESVAILRKALAADDAILTGTVMKLAGVLKKSDKQEEAIALLREQVASVRGTTYQSLEGFDNLLIELAEILLKAKRFSEAESLFREAHKNLVARHGPEHESVLTPTAKLALLLFHWAWSEYEVRANAAPPPRSEAVLASANLPTAHKRAAEAARLLQECLATRLRGSNPSYWRAADVRVRLGAAMLVAAVTEHAMSQEAWFAKLAEAESLLLQGQEELQAMEKVESRYKHAALLWLVRLYQVWGKAEEASVWQQKLDDSEKAAAKTKAASDADSPKP